MLMMHSYNPIYTSPLSLYIYIYTHIFIFIFLFVLICRAYRFTCMRLSGYIHIHMGVATCRPVRFITCNFDSRGKCGHHRGLEEPGTACHSHRVHHE